jgi:hypothetical protein
MTFRGKSGREYVVIASGGLGTLGGGPRGAGYKEVQIACALPKPGETPVDLAQYAPVIPIGGFGPRSRVPAAAPPPPAVPLGLTTGEVTLPDGPGKEDVQTMCGQCHGVSTAIAVRHSSDAWHDLIQDMRSRGAQRDEAKSMRIQN